MSSAADPIGDAARRLGEGGIVAFPTETVFGLGVDAANSHARTRLVALKGQPADKPLQILIPDAGGLAAFSPDAGDAGVRRLAERFWPGPLTLVLPAHGEGTVGVRVPDHPVILALLARFGRPLAATSANRHGEPECPDAAAVAAQFGQEEVFLLSGDAGAAVVASTVVRYEEGRATILRHGLIPEAEIRACLEDFN